MLAVDAALAKKMKTKPKCGSVSLWLCTKCHPLQDDVLFVERCGSVVACMTCKQEIVGSIPSWAELCSNIVLLVNALFPHMHSPDPGVSGYPW